MNTFHQAVQSRLGRKARTKARITWQRTTLSAAIVATCLATVGCFSGTVAAQTAGSGPRTTAPMSVTKTVACLECGTVVSVTPKKVKGKASWVGTVGGAVAGGVVGNQIGNGTGNKVATVAGAAGGAIAGREIEKRVKKKEVFDVVVKMDDGSMRTITKTEKGSTQPGDKVKVVGETITTR